MFTRVFDALQRRALPLTAGRVMKCALKGAKMMRKTVTVLLSALMIFFSFAVSAGAVTAPMQYGDVDFDDVVSVNDATCIQRYLAGLAVLENTGLVAGDYDRDGRVTVADATCIQRRLANLAVPETCGGVYLTDVRVCRFFASYDSGKAMALSPVVFTAGAEGSGGDFTYEFLIDGAVVQPRSEDSTLTYVFETAGDFTVAVRAYNVYGVYHEATLGYTVSAPYPVDGVMLRSVHFDSISNMSAAPVLTADAMGGTSPYEYSFSIFTAQMSDEDLTEKPGEWCFSQDFSAKNTLEIEMDALEWDERYLILVQARDADGELSEVIQVPYLNALSAG